ncbi:Gfo/Idh/MocA family oxidoreductase [Alkalihalobacillus oceani]|uniref:Gfo/Idh/MocA family protein n=1 Tax=Halalkalibacter oceani TaxID=1653776 RepID=UPI00203C1DCE|nr:Gfo/Idh/MocA family oxidoreductase [Halalkalibacter oceani]MCM3761876.1 Gfo/Idh/MocA family oxidoreductase [Halalkalibacter oceani]
MKRGIGLIGCGRMTQKHIETIGRLEDAYIAAISDISMERMKVVHDELLAQNRVTTRFAMYQNYQELLANPDVDLVVIATTSGTHSAIAKDCLLAKKHTIVEKPLALSLDESRRLNQLAEKVEKSLFVCHQMRHRPILFTIKELIDSGALGRLHLAVVMMEIQRSDSYYQAAKWRGTWDQDGGMLVNQGIHLVDLMLWYMGEAQEIFGDLHKVNQRKETEDIALGMIKFSNGGRGLIQANTVTQPANLGYSIRLFGDEGTIIVSGKNFDHLERFEIKGQEKLTGQLDQFLEDRSEQLRMYNHILAELAGKRDQLTVSGKEAEKALELIFALYESSRQKRPVSLPLHTFATKNMKEGEAAHEK